MSSVIDIEREVKLGSAIHSTGMLIPNAFLAGQLTRKLKAALTYAECTDFSQVSQMRAVSDIAVR